MNEFLDDTSREGSAIRSAWQTPVVILSDVEDTEVKGTTPGDFTSSGRSYGS